ncbi:MAG TPA: TonB-dependent receptor [Steroidobacteraceae bacterium]|nr:TonB-dependent receptor [Steroidobacteraceae bacterium]
MKGHLHRRLSASGLLVAMVAPATVLAQSAEKVELGEIIVTAQHVEENLQKAAISATIATGDSLIERGIVDTAGLAKLVPGISIAPNNAYTNYNIRGITSGGTNALSDTAIAVNYNEVSLATPSSASGLYYDLERVELVNGPQGTLYGRNATAGAINVVARKPIIGEFSGNIGLDGGNYDSFNGRFALNVPLSGIAAMRIAGQTANHSGYYSDGSSNQHDKAVRISFLATPTDQLSLYLTGDYASTDSNGLGTTLQQACGTSFCFVAGPRTGLQDLMQYLPQARPENYTDSYFWGLTGTLTWNTDAGTLTVIPAFRRHSAHTIANNASFGSLRGFDEPIQKSIEVRFASPQDQRFKYQVGVYGLKVDMDGLGNSETAANRSYSANFYTSETTSYAPFAQLTYSLTDSLRIVGGARYTTDKKSTDSLRYTLLNIGGANVVLPDTPPAVGPNVRFNLELDESKKWTSTTYKAGLEWDIAPEHFAYFDVRSGFKAGGYFFGPPGNNTYNPEKLTAYSFGSKNRFFDNRLQANLEAFLYDYSGQQLAVNLLLNGQQVVTTQNVGHSKIKGSELTVDWLALENTRFGFNVQWAKGDYDSLIYVQSTGKATSGTASTSRCVVTPLAASQFQWDCSGLGFPGLSKWAYNLDGEQTFHLPGGSSISVQANYRYQGPRDTSLQFTNGSRTAASKFMDANLQLRAPSGNWDVTAYVNNLIRNQAIVRAQATGVSNSVIYFAGVAAPRTYGLRTNFRF